MTSTEISSTVPDLPAVDEGKGGRRGLKIFDVVWIGVLTFVLSVALGTVYGFIYGVYLGAKGYTPEEITGHLSLPEGQSIFVVLGLVALSVGPLLFATYFARRRGLGLIDFGLRKSDHRYFLYAFLGLVFVLCVGFGLETFLDPSEVARLNEANNGLLAPDGLLFVVSLIFVVVLVPFAEEIFFRAAMYGAFVQRMPPLVAGFLATSIFTAVHTQYLLLGGQAAFVGLIQVFLLGSILAWLYTKSGSIWPSVFLHSANNAIAFIAIIYLV